MRRVREYSRRRRSDQGSQREIRGNVFLILAAYNAGERRVFAAKGVPPISEPHSQRRRCSDPLHWMDVEFASSTSDMLFGDNPPFLIC